eukprot:8683376-Karenia_brevis.AAC.1
MASSLRERDLFPLPVPEVPGINFEHAHNLSRSGRRRLLRKHHSAFWEFEGVQPLNELSGFPFSDPPSGTR